MISSVGKKTITAAGGAQTVPISNSMCRKYYISFRSIGVTPLAGTTAISATPTGGTEEAVTDSLGVAVNINPTALKAIIIDAPIESIKITPSSWTADVEIVCEILGEA